MSISIDVLGMCRICLNEEDLLDVLLLGEPTSQWMMDINRYFGVQVSIFNIHSCYHRYVLVYPLNGIYTLNPPSHTFIIRKIGSFIHIDYINYLYDVWLTQLCHCHNHRLKLHYIILRQYCDVQDKIIYINTLVRQKSW